MNGPESALSKGPPKLVRGGTLDAIRLFASVFIVVFHFSDFAPFSIQSLHPALLRGFLATDFFLVLSGYVLSRAYGASVLTDSVADFWFFIKRLSRVWPPHALVLILLVGATIVAHSVGYAPRDPHWFNWSQLPTQVFLLQSLGVPGGNGWNLPSWTLSALLICYSLFPFIWRVQSRIKSAWIVLGLAWVIVFLAAWVAQATLGQSINGASLHYGLLRTGPMFLLGLAIARVIQDVPISKPVAQRIGLAGVIWFVALLLRPERHDVMALVGIVAIIFSAAAQPVLKPSKFFQEGAEMSFSIYITHVTWATMWFGAFHALSKHIPLSETQRWVIWGAGCVFALCFAALFHFWVDQPLQKFIRSKLGQYQDRGPGRAQNVSALPR
jgi:peptidoglycan/LPS O-acetylase OafA/YrhL